MPEWLNQVYFGYTLLQYLEVTGVCVGLLLAQWLLQAVLLNWLDDYTQRTKTDIDNILVTSARTPLRLVALSLAILLLSDILSVNPGIAHWIERITGLMHILAGILFASGAVELLSQSILHWLSKRGTPLDPSVKFMMDRVFRVIVWSLGILMVIQFLGYSVTAIVASLGIGGAAIAFASQDTIANVFGSMKVLIDRPFTLGDWIKSSDGSIEGVVEDIGFLSTRIRTFADTQITVPNNKIANLAIENFNRMTKRRIYTNIGLTYETTTRQIQRIGPRMKQYLMAHAEIDDELIFVNFTSFNTSSLDIMVYFFTKTTAWGDWLRIREEIYLEFMRIIESEGAQIAVPARQLHFQQPPDRVFQDLAQLEDGEKTLEKSEQVSSQERGTGEQRSDFSSKSSPKSFKAQGPDSATPADDGANESL